MSKAKGKPRSVARFKIGEKLRVRHGVTDTDYPNMPLGGWTGVVAEVHDNGMCTIRWNEETLASSAAEPSDQLPSPPRGQTWKLTWHDEFDGDKLDGTKWETPDHKRRDGWWSPMEGWHTFALWWENDKYVFYVDGKETWRTEAGGVGQVPLYIKLSDKIGDWGGDIRKAKLPDRFLVDYVRVYDPVDAE